MIRQIRLTKEVNFNSNFEVGDAYAVEYIVGAFQIERIIICIKRQDTYKGAKVRHGKKRD